MKFAVPEERWALGHKVLVLALLAMGCKITIGGDGRYGNLDLKVPFVYQGELRLCAPASVAMWRRYDGLSALSPEQLGNQMGCPWQTTGCSRNQTVDGVVFFTATGRDAFLDDWGGVDSDGMAQERYLSRQITSLVNGSPVIGLIQGGLHAVVVVAGNFSTSTSGLKRWDSIYIHDPQRNAYVGQVPGTWADVAILQILSRSATLGWEGNFLTYGDEVEIRGRRGWPPDDWPPPV